MFRVAHDRSGTFIRCGARTFSLLSLLASGVLLSGCELYDLVGKALQNYSTQSTVGIFVHPPVTASYLEITKRSDEPPAVREGFFFSEDIKEALLDGVMEFNNASKHTRVNAFYSVHEEGVFDFYKRCFGTPDWKENTRQWVENRRRRGGEVGDVSAIIFGTFHQNTSNSTKYNCVLYIYDYKSDTRSSVFGPVEVDPGRIQNAELEDLMKRLLERAYN